MSQYRNLVGRVFRHPTTHRLHEVVHVYWDLKEQKVGAYRTTLPDHINDPDDLHPYEVEGPSGIAALVDEYARSSYWIPPCEN